MKHRAIAVATLALIAVLLVVAPVFAYIYRATYTVTSENTTDFEMIGVTTDNDTNNQWMADNGFMNSTANDTRVETLGGLIKPHMVTDNATFTAIPVPANSQTNLYFSTGNSEQDFDIIPGYDGYVTVADASNLEFGGNFTITQSGWVDTSYSANITLVHKERAFKTFINQTGNITTAINYWLNPTGTNDPGGAKWANDGNIIDDDDTTFANTTAGVGAGVWSDYLEATHAGTEIIEVWMFTDLTDTNFSLVDIDINSGGWQDLYQGSFTDATWLTASANTTITITAARIRFYNNDVNPHTPRLYEVVFDSTDISVTAIGVASGEHTVKTSGGDIVWADWDTTLFDGTQINSNINCGNGLYAAGRTLWLDFWFILDEDVSAGVGTNSEYNLWTIRQDGSNKAAITIVRAPGYLQFTHVSGGATKFACTTGATHTSWSKDVPYHVFASMSDNGTRILAELYIDNIFADTATDAARNGLPNGKFLIGDYEDPGVGGLGMIGNVSNFRVGTDNVSASERTAMFTGVSPGDETNLWYIDEGTGATIIDYGTGGNNGTLDTNASWEVDNRPCKLVLEVDGADEDALVRTTPTVPDNAFDWTLYDGAMIYSDNTSMSVNGTLQLWFRPNDIIAGTNLPDRATSVATNNGTFVWGDNPAGVAVAMGGLVSPAQPSPGLVIDDPTPDIMPGVEVTDWYIEPDVTGALLTNPIRPFVIIMSDTTTLTELQSWRLLGTALLLSLIVATAKTVRGHQGITAIAAGAGMIGLVALTIYPMWSVVVAVIMFIGGLIAERSPSL